jgi:predicted dehydrogenase
MEKEDSIFSKWSRRDLLKGLGGIPVLGAVWFGGAKIAGAAKRERNFLLETLNVKASPPPPSGPMSGKPVRLGIIGFGIRGEQLCRALGFATTQWLDEMKENTAKNPNDTRLKEFLAQENLNIQLAAICDIFDARAQKALDSFNTKDNKIKRYKTHKELFASGDIDAVVIATPDHWHTPISLDAIAAGIHVYVEKPMTHNISETYAVRDAVLANPKIVFAVGHQHRQTQSFLTAQDIISKNLLGHISLVETNTNRNDDNGAWQYDIHPDASPSTIDWKTFLGNAPDEPFNAEHFFRWRKWWAYGSGLSGDLLTHDYDRLNCVLKMGIPSAVVASGGIYTHRDGRNVPDVMQVNMEFPEFVNGGSQEGKQKGMTFVYSATLGNQYDRGTVLMGHDGSMELGNMISVYADPRSTKYKDLIKDQRIDPLTPIYQYDPAANGTDAVTSATAKYFANKGLLWTYRDGKRVDTTFLHLREFLSCIRNGGKPSCGIQEGFEEAISAHMAGLSYKIGRRVEWDKEAQKIIALPGEDLDAILIKNVEKVTLSAMA